MKANARKTIQSHSDDTARVDAIDWARSAFPLLDLGNLDPAHGKEFEQNRRAFLQRIDARLPAWEQRMVALQGKPLVAYHGGWAYFARRFRLDIAGLIEPRPGVQPSPAHLAGLIRLMRERNIGIILREPHEPERDGAFLAAKTGAAMVTLAGSVGATPEAADYMALLEFNVDTLAARVSR